MVVQALGEMPAELRVTPEQDERLAAQAKTVAPGDVSRLLELIAAALRALKDGADARTQLELALVKAAQPAHDASTRALQARLERLEARLAAGPRATPPPPRDPAEPATAAGRTQVAVRAQMEGQPPVEAITTVPGAPEGGRPDAQAVADRAAETVRAEVEPDAAVSAVAVVEPDAPAGEASLELSLASFTELWPAVLESIEAESPRLAALLRQAQPHELADDGLTIAWPESAAFSKRQAEEPAKREVIASAVRAVTGASLRLAHELRDDAVPAPADSLSDEELVERFKQEFSAEEVPPPPPPKEEP
jgi:DNA polymerase-3 subunit gamma/tau